jgi:hypothetical protein
VLSPRNSFPLSGSGRREAEIVEKNRLKSSTGYCGSAAVHCFRQCQCKHTSTNSGGQEERRSRGVKRDFVLCSI